MQNLPETLWCNSQIVMPPNLAQSYRDELEHHGLFHAACGPNPKYEELIGGEGTEDAVKHFTHRFINSSARVQYVVLSPCGTFDKVSCAMLSFILDGKVSILDIPCGAGGGLLGYLGTVAEMRQQGLVPQTPVHLTVLAGDISPDARTIHESMLKKMAPSFSRVGIRLSSHYLDWDVKDVFSTGRLVDEWFDKCPTEEEYMIFVSAFSGFADKNKEQVVGAFQSIVGRFHSKPCRMIWVEPVMKQSTRFLKFIGDYLKKWLGSGNANPDTTEENQFRFTDPFTAKTVPSRVQVRSFVRRQTENA